MKKIIIFSLMALCLTTSFAQEVTLTFSARDITTNNYLPLTRVAITNVSQGWTDTLAYPDTTVVLYNNVGIQDVSDNVLFGLQQNNPNPFNGITNVNLTITEPGKVTMEVADMNGRQIAAKPMNASDLQPGIHQFRVKLSDAGVYFLTARQNGKTSSVTVVNNGSCSANGIEYLGAVERFHATAPQPKSTGKDGVNHTYSPGDQMIFKGFVHKYDSEIESVSKTHYLSSSASIVLMVDYINASNPRDSLPCFGMPTLMDIDGNMYSTVTIGNQCWMRENLRTTRYPDGTAIPVGDTTSLDSAYRYYPNGDSSNVATYGFLYNWKAVINGSPSSCNNPSGVQGVCPTGWHLPSDAEWQELEVYIGMDPYDVEALYERGDSAVLLCGSFGWHVSEVPNSPGDFTVLGRNKYGFTAIPAGIYAGAFLNFTRQTKFWSCTLGENNDVYDRGIAYVMEGIIRAFTSKENATSVRCLMNR